MTQFETSMKVRMAAKAAEIRHNRLLWQVANTVCADLGIVRDQTTLVSYIGNGQGKSNLDAIKRWLDTEYENLITEFDPPSARKVSDILALNLAPRIAPLGLPCVCRGVSIGGGTFVSSVQREIAAEWKAVNTWGRSIRSQFPLQHIWAVFCSKVRGHIQYYGVSFNFRAVQTFQMKATRILVKWLNRRSQRRSFNWEQFALYIGANPLPKVTICHALF